MTGEKILIVDDSPESRSWLAQTVLQPAGYTILEASSLPAAHKKIAAIRPDLIVLDAQVSPAKDELSFVAEYTTSFPIVITTTHR
jgi:CheY-like chemotaxis protein